MIGLIEFFAAIAVVTLFLVGAVLLALRWRIREDVDQQDLLEVDDDQPKRRFPKAFRGEYTRVL